MPPPELTEVKASWEIKRNEEEYAAKFAAAHNFAAERGWIFNMKTEKEIRIPRLENLRFLRRYRSIEVEAGHTARLVDQVRSHGGRSTSERLLADMGRTDDERMFWLPVMWHALIKGHLHVAMDIAMPADVPVSLPGVAA